MAKKRFKLTANYPWSDIPAVSEYDELAEALSEFFAEIAEGRKVTLKASKAVK